VTWIGGLEALFSWSPPGAPEPVITLGGSPYRLTGITGLSSLGDSEANADPRVGSVGETPRLSQRRGRTVVYEGRIIASGLLELREAETALREAFDDQSVEGHMQVAAHPDNVELADQSAKYFNARALNVDIIDQQATRTWTRNFVVGLRLSDPRLYDVEEERHELSIVNTKSVYSF
jgi:hypothetical protein